MGASNNMIMDLQGSYTECWNEVIDEIKQL